MSDEPEGTARDPKWKNRIIGLGEMAPDDLLANPNNHRIHPKFQQDALEGVLDDVGMVQTIVVNKTTGFIVDGHLRATLAIRTGQTSIPVLFVDLSPEEESKVLLTLDAIGALAVQDDDKVRDLLAEVTTSDQRVQAMLERMGAELKDPPTDIDDQLPLPAEPIAKLGQLYQLGPHRLYCGDCTDPASWRRLFRQDAGGDEDTTPDATTRDPARLATMLWTDPPYDVDYTGKTQAAMKILNDTLGHEGTIELLTDSLGNALAHLPQGAPVYVFAPHGPQFLAFAVVATAQGWWRQTILWVKDAFALGRSDLHYRHEAIVAGAVPEAQPDPELQTDPERAKDSTALAYGWTPGSRHEWFGGRYQDTVWEVPRPRKSDEHPTAKPVELAVRPLLNSSRPGDIVLDCFAGSGPLLRAAHLHKRIAYLMELDPKFVDVILAWYERTTGDTPQLLEDPTPAPAA